LQRTIKTQLEENKANAFEMNEPFKGLKRWRFAEKYKLALNINELQINMVYMFIHCSSCTLFSRMHGCFEFVRIFCMWPDCDLDFD
jgi:hypothetical protein